MQRLNYDARGQYLGEFHTDDVVLVVLESGMFYTTNFDLNNHYEPTGIMRIEKFDPHKVWTAVLFDADQQNFPYVKRFNFERCSQARMQSFMGENSRSQFVLLSDNVYPRLQITFGGSDAYRDPMEVDVSTYIGVKSFKAKGKRLTTCTVDKIEELEPLRFPTPADEAKENAEDEDTIQTSAEEDEAVQSPTLFDEENNN